MNVATLSIFVTFIAAVLPLELQVTIGGDDLTIHTSPSSRNLGDNWR